VKGYTELNKRRVFGSKDNGRRNKDITR